MAIDPTGPSARDDRSTYLHRQCIGTLGALLPLLVWLIAGFRPADGATTPWRLLSSISGYYHTSGVVAFVAVLAALSIFLLTYRGFANKHGTQDRVTAWLAGIAAAGVAFFPTQAQVNLGWLKPWVWYSHYTSAAVLFSCFAFFSLFLFTKSDTKRPTVGKRVRNVVHVVCGVGILICLLWIVVAVLSKRTTAGDRSANIFWPEALALEFFALSWLTKGRADHTFARVASKTVEYARDPKALAHDLGRGMRQLSGAEVPPAKTDRH